MEQENTRPLQSGLSETSLRKCPRCNTVFSAIAYCPNDGTKLEDHHGEEPLHGVFADKYEILEEIGKGGMGTVYRVRQVLLDKILALKVIPSHYLNEQLLARFQREAKTMAALNHANLARVSDFGIWLNQPFMVMEYVSGSPLSKLIAERVIPPAQAINLFGQVLDGLEHAHAQGVLHRDIKPSNIMIVGDEGTNKAVLLDFGIAKKMEADDAKVNTPALTRTGEMIGSPLYMSPEQARGEKVTERSDLYSLGCALFESLTGTPPFVGKTAVETFFLHIEQVPPSLKEAALGREFSPALEKILRRVLSKNPEDRYSSAAELKAALLACLEERKAEEKAPAPEPKKDFSLPVLPALSAAIVAGLMVSAVFFFTQKTEKQPVKNPSQSQSQTPPTAFNERSLSFFSTTLNDEDVERIVKNSNLRELKMVQCKLAEGLIGKLPRSLERLELDGCGLINSDVQLIAELPNLRVLSLKYGMVNRGLQYLAPMKKLELLDLTSIHCDLETTKQLSALKNLKYLLLANNDTLDDNCLEVIAGMDNLEWLDISVTGATQHGISKLAQLPKLKRLAAGGLRIDDTSAACFKSFTKLKTLKLRDNPISAKGLRKIPANQNMTELDLHNTYLQDDAMTHILEFKNLTDLDVSNKHISSEALMKLAKLPLKILHAKQTSLSKLEAREFLDRCPTCQVVYFGANGNDVFVRRDDNKTDNQAEDEYQMP